MVPVWSAFKHASLLHVVGATRTSIASQPAKPSMTFEITVGGEKYNPEILLPVRLSNPDDDYDVNLTLQVAFGEIKALEGKAVVPTLRQLIDFTTRIVDIFGRHIFR
jgi:hypothetical protein